MEKLMYFLNSIDWMFGLVLLIAGRYWGGKFFKVIKHPPLNFLIFATAFGIAWVGIQFLSGEAIEWPNLLFTYLVVTSFYEILGKKLFQVVENWVGGTEVKPIQNANPNEP
jgi:hypothetical protein